MTGPIDVFSGMTSHIDGRQAAASDDPEVVGRQLEGMFVEMMLKEMRKAMPEGGLFGGSEMGMFTELLDRELAQRLSDGPGLGIARQLAGVGARLRPVKDPVRAARLPLRGMTKTSGFGWRRDPFTGHESHHGGLDLAAPRGTAIHPVRGGVVTRVGEAGGLGRIVTIDHGDGVEITYAHCDSLKARLGQRVEAGDVIATVGSSGRSTGPHLHLELRVDGKVRDPEAFFDWEDFIGPEP